jgi:hypothetical protein
MSVKTMIFGFAAAGVGGAALTSGGLGGGPDAEHMVARPPAEVYAAISSMSPEGLQQGGRENGGPPMTFEVRKEPGRAVHYVLKIDGKVAGSIDFDIAPEQGGAASRLSADIDLDRAALRKVMPGGDEVLRMPDAVFNLAAQGVLGEMAKKIEAGTPLEGFGPEDLAAWQAHPSGGAGQGMSGELPVAGPLGSTEPMVDPNAAARNYLKGGQ